MRPNKDATKSREPTRRAQEGLMGRVLDSFGQLIARYLQRPVRGYEPFTPSDPDALRQSLAPGDVLLVEGNNHISGVIKYLTQSTWSHSALYVGPIEGRFAGGRRAARSDRGQCRRRRRVGAAVEVFPLPHPHLPAGRPDRGRLLRRCAPTPSPASASPTTSRTSSTCCAICCRCRCRNAGGGA